MLNISDF